MLTLLAGVGFVALIFGAVFGLMKSSDAYKDAMTKASADPRVQAAFGTPIHAGFFVNGSIKISGSSGEASIAIPISGPRAKGTLFVEARKSAGKWNFSVLAAEVKGSSERIDLLAPADKAPESAPAGTDSPAVEHL